MSGLKKTAVSIAALGISFLFTTTGVAQEKLVLKGVTPWTQDYELSRSFFIFKDLVEEKLGERVEIDYLGGPEVANPEDQVSALKNGVVDVMLGAAAYYRSEIPLAAAVQFTSLLPSELRENGYFDLMQEIHADGGVHYLANTAGGNQFRLYVNKEVDGPDLSGLRLRGSAVQLPMIEALGATAVSISPGDVYTALERNVVDGYGWTYNGIDAYGWNEVTKYVIDQPFYSLDGAILFNQEVWDSLDPELQDAFNELAIELEKEVEEYTAESLRAEDEKLINEYNIEFIEFNKEDAQRFLDIANKAGWEHFVSSNQDAFDANPGLESRLKELSD